jgi:hypothetical protein
MPGDFANPMSLPMLSSSATGTSITVAASASSWTPRRPLAWCIDRLLAEQLPLERTTFAVREAPVLKDATRSDAKFAGLDRLAEVIDTGSDAPSTVLADCSQELRQRFAAADVIVAKGQGNYETLSEEPRDIFFLFAVTCDVAARHVGLPHGTQVLLRPAAGNGATAQPAATVAAGAEE